MNRVETPLQALAATVSVPGVEVLAVDHHRVVCPEGAGGRCPEAMCRFGLVRQLFRRGHKPITE